MLQAVTLVYWNTLFVDHGGRERERRRAALLEKELDSLGMHRAPAVVEDALASGYAYFDSVWRHERRTPDAAEVVRVVLSALEAPLPPTASARITDGFGRLLLDMAPDPVPNARRVLLELAESFRLAVICDTGYSPGRVLRELLDRHGMLEPFSYLYFSDEHALSKPDPEVFRRVLDELQVVPMEAVHVGDMQRTDIEGAKAAGMWTVLFVGANDRDAGATTADAVVRRFDDLPKAIANLMCPGC